ncbi:hypothetical protein GAO09_08805 [Rhizobiales bacterium RZME27]|uniref:Uncharacterized protein n=1 Tax=Endobacterium cereale TaxID=2663029 RepID=A0A6A8A5I8_9HYPH|nr:hypothetical protein [Endobacterium cereale]MEB2848162.1 hypothetical protein [Endobacterium cereale]MQY46149.1 hypothetical protein [Endobacterium cereale]
MSSNEYSGYVSQNLARSSTFGYHEQAALGALLKTAVTGDATRNLPLAAMRAFPNFGVDGKIRVLTTI